MARHSLALPVVLLAAAIAVSPAASAGETRSKQLDQARPGPIRSDPPHFGDYLVARTAQLDHDWRTAGMLMRRAWAADPGSTDLRHEALLLSVAGGDLAGALEVARAVPSDSSDAPLGRFVMTVDDLAAARYAAVETRLGASPKTGLDRYLVPVFQAWSEAARGRKAEALAALAGLGSVDGTAELRAIQEAMIREAFGDKAEASSLYAGLLAGKPSPRAASLAARFYQRAGEPELARAAIERLDPDGAAASLRAEMLARVADRKEAGPAPEARSACAGALFDIASSLASDRQADIAPLLYLQFALALDPQFPAAQLLLAELQQRWGRLDDASETLLAVDAKSALRSTADRMAMAVLAKAGQADKALAVGKAAVEAHPEDIDLALYYGDQLRVKSRFPEAIAAYDAALGRLPEISNRRGIALYHRGIAYQQSHQWPRAETDLLAALQLRPDDPGILNYLGFSWADQGVNLDRARTMLERAVQLVPDDGAIVDSLGWVMYRSGDYDDAVKQLEKAVSLDADDADINDHLGDAYWRVGREIEARAQWERAQHLTTDKDQAEQIRIKLRDGLGQAPAPRRASAD